MIVTLFQEIPKFSECGQDDAEAQLINDVADSGYQILNEEKIVAVVQNEECADVHQNDSDGKEREEAKSEPIHAEAFTAITTAMAQL